MQNSGEVSWCLDPREENEGRCGEQEKGKGEE